MSKISCLELFAGAGGLATGIRLSGVQHKAFIDWNKNACQTLSHNYSHKLVHNIDIREFDFNQFGYVDMIAGGPPCQPFSMGGNHKGNRDQRDMFPYVCKAITTCIPKVFIFENVKGLLRKSFARYFEYLILRLIYPDVDRKDWENWDDHLRILEQIHTSGNYDGVKYKVVFRLVDAADYGIPQRRERVFIVGIREDLTIQWSFPKKTHSLDGLLWSQFVSYDYWEKHGIKPSTPENLDKRTQQRVNRLKQQLTLFTRSLKPWKTVRDQIGKLPEPDSLGSFDLEHVLRKGARIYPGHTGSYIDMPSKALKAGDHGVPGGENMIRYHDGRVRYYTTYEAKRIQTFPDNYKILGSWTEAMRQIGNAVPVELSHHIADSLVKVI
ncbi:MAG: DNA cytosine methyltransferase [Moorea sp. SIO4A3]|nr:DNA cytosine methyltransferase [Moorena sp. SIO4A3]